MSRNFELLRRAERERQHRPASELPMPPELRASSPIYESLLESGAAQQERARPAESLWEGEVVEGLCAPLSRSAREKVTSLVRGLFLLPASTVRSVSVGSTEPSTGVASITLGVAECLSSLTSGRVCAVDVDFDHPRLQAHFQPRSIHGFSDVLQGKASLGEALTRVAPNLWILPAGSGEGQTLGHSSEGLMEILSALRREADYLLLQSPALSETSAAIAFGKMTDGVIVVVEANRTRRDFAQTLKAKLDAAHVRVLGAVFNNRTYPIPRSIYSRL
jgi:Mrp family chromosome partitioning ATPase